MRFIHKFQWPVGLFIETTVHLSKGHTLNVRVFPDVWKLCDPPPIKRQMPITSQPITAYRLQNQKPYKPRQCGIFNQGISLSSILIQVSIMAKIRPEKKIFLQNSAD
jgi:hypothetical protein